VSGAMAKNETATAIWARRSAVSDRARVR